MVTPTPSTPRDLADAMLADLLTHIANRQDAYFEQHNRYFQGICTHAEPPADGVEAAPNLTARPDYQAEDWLDAGFMLPDEMVAALEIHTYDGPLGQGWLIIMKVIEDKQVWRRVKATGPEAKGLAKDWDQVIEDAEQKYGLDR